MLKVADHQSLIIKLLMVAIEDQGDSDKHINTAFYTISGTRGESSESDHLSMAIAPEISLIFPKSGLNFALIYQLISV